MKSVTKLGRASNASGALPPPPLPSDEANGNSGVEGLKRKYREALEEQAVQLQSLSQAQADILRELQSLVRLAQAQPRPQSADVSS